jgi:hypothetical protein
LQGMNDECHSNCLSIFIPGDFAKRQANLQLGIENHLKTNNLRLSKKG